MRPAIGRRLRSASCPSRGSSPSWCCISPRRRRPGWAPTISSAASTGWRPPSSLFIRSSPAGGSPRRTRVAACGVHGALVVGERLDLARLGDPVSALSEFTVVLESEGGDSRRGHAGDVLGGPLHALKFLVDEIDAVSGKRAAPRGGAADHRDPDRGDARPPRRDLARPVRRDRDRTPAAALGLDSAVAASRRAGTSFGPMAPRHGYAGIAKTGAIGDQGGRSHGKRRRIIDIAAGRRRAGRGQHHVPAGGRSLPRRAHRGRGGPAA